MKKLLIAILLCFTASAHSQPKPDEIAAMLKRCEAAMALGACSVARDETFYPPGTPGPLIAGYGRVPLIAYIRLQNQQGFMCPYAEMHCTKDPKGDVCKVAQALWGAR